MNHQDFARRLIENSSPRRRALFAAHPELLDAELAKSLQQICYEVWTSAPQQVSVIVDIFGELSDLTRDPEIKAYQEWTTAIQKLVNGKLEACLEWLEKSERTFLALDRLHTAATTQISRLYALALLGRYDEAVECGLRAREIFIAERDFYSVGKIEHNIGNLYWRRDFYREAEPFLDSARARFERLGDERQLAMVENCQAFVAALQNNFRRAETIYERALARATGENLTVTEAEIEIGLSNLYLFQGRLDLALRLMERSRQKYERLGLPHQSASCELEIADIYLELNLLPEAISFYERTQTNFAELGMQAELARSFFSHARALLALDRIEEAEKLLGRAEKLFAAEGNPISVALVRLTRARFFYRDHNPAAAEREAETALEEFTKGGNRRHELLARWFLGEIWLAGGAIEKAAAAFRRTLKGAAKDRIRQIEYLCLLALGKITGDEKYFLDAVRLIENSRSALSAEEFRSAFFSDKLLPYNELVKINLGAGKLAEALSWHERSRSRSLLDAMNGTIRGAREDSPHTAKASALREELNWFYSRINRQTASGLEVRANVAQLQKLAARRESELAEIERRLHSGERAESRGEVRDFDLGEFQRHLTETTVVEFAVIDDRLRAFLISEANFEVFTYHFQAREIKHEVEQFLFQIKSGRHLEKLSAANRRVVTARFLRRSQTLNEALMRPLEKFWRERRLVVVAADFLHYLPFQALYDGAQFLIEKREISYAPSLSVLQNCLQRERAAYDNALLVGAANGDAPFIEREIETLGKLFKRSVKLSGAAATLENLRANLENSGVLHLACHGKFRLDNPDFSALNLFAENLTVKDARALDLKNKLVVLSACETGINKIVSGEELYGLTRGFLSSGASSLLLSLWTVGDRSTADLMQKFYRRYLQGKSASRALQIAQIEMLRKNIHPYFWAAFVLTGRW